MTRRTAAPKPKPATAKPRRARRAAGAPPFQLTFAGGYNASGDRTAELRSPVLDPVMHPSGVVPVMLRTDPHSTGSKKNPTFVLDGFHVESLLEFLRSQAAIRKAVDRILKADYHDTVHDLPEVTSPEYAANPWSGATFQSLFLRVRDVPSPETIKDWKTRFSAREVREMVASCDDPTLRSFFALNIKVAWDDEHWRNIEYRDGALGEVRNE